MSKKNAFEGFKYEKPVVETLKEGNHVVRINSKSLTDSFHLLNGDVKDGLIEKIDAEEHWSDSTAQLAIVIVSMNNDGVMTYRFNIAGYKHQDDFTEEELNDPKYVVIGDYVCTHNKQNKIVRIKCEQRTQKAKRILNQFLLATGAEEGEDLMDILDNCIADKTQFGITVKKGSYQDKTTYDIAKFTAVGVETPAEGIGADEF